MLTESKSMEEITTFQNEVMEEIAGFQDEQKHFELNIS